MSEPRTARSRSDPGAATSRWAREAQGRSDTYDDYWVELAARGKNIHGEVDCVQRLCPAPASVLDAGCGTGRVAVELAVRGYDVVGVDLDPDMVAKARAKDPHIAWTVSDLATVDLNRRFDAVVAAGNVMIFLEPGTEADVVANLARHLAPEGRLIAGFSLEAGRLDLVTYDAHAAAAGLVIDGRFSTWDGDAYEGGDYAVSVHRRAG